VEEEEKVGDKYMGMEETKTWKSTRRMRKKKTNAYIIKILLGASSL
jgi:hypothetical protein